MQLGARTLCQHAASPASDALYTAADAVFSVGNYLRSFGCKDGLTEQQQLAVVRRYNNSELYAATVLGAAARLRPGAKATP